MKSARTPRYQLPKYEGHIALFDRHHRAIPEGELYHAILPHDHLLDKRNPHRIRKLRNGETGATQLAQKDIQQALIRFLFGTFSFNFLHSVGCFPAIPHQIVVLASVFFQIQRHSYISDNDLL